MRKTDLFPLEYRKSFFCVVEGTTNYLLPYIVESKHSVTVVFYTGIELSSQFI